MSLSIQNQVCVVLIHNAGTTQTAQYTELEWFDDGCHWWHVSSSTVFAWYTQVDMSNITLWQLCKLSKENNECVAVNRGIANASTRLQKMSYQQINKNNLHNWCWRVRGLFGPCLSHLRLRSSDARGLWEGSFCSISSMINWAAGLTSLKYLSENLRGAWQILSAKPAAASQAHR